jgi:glyoxylase-like metal-dependent hydrolase (beta-lactamase superfamily II)
MHGSKNEPKGKRTAMTIDTIQVGMLETNCYIISDEDSNAAIIDPGAEPGRIIEIIESRKLVVRAILLTHTHNDHVGALQAVRERFQVPVVISEPEARFYNVRADEMEPFQGRIQGQKFLTINHGDQIPVGRLTLTALMTPGHTPGGTCYRNGGDVFTGDTLFQDGVGRTDFPGGNTTQLMESIRVNLLSLPDHTRIYPGHGPSSTIGIERDYFGS